MTDATLRLTDLRTAPGPGALDGVTLEVAPGALVVVVGTARSGRTALVDAIAGRVRVAAGSVHVDGVDVRDRDEARRAALVGWAGRASALAPGLTVAEHLALAAGRGGRARPARAAWQERLHALGLSFGLDARVAALAPAERRALALVMATLGDPKLLLLDRPADGLDGRGADRVARLVEDLLAPPRPATLLVADALQQAVALGDRLVVLHAGAVVGEVGGEDKRRLRVVDLRARLDALAREAPLDDSLAELLAATWV